MTTPNQAASQAPDWHHDDPRELLTVEAAAARLSISRTRMFALIKTGDVTSVRIGRLRRIPADALREFTTRLTTTQHAAA